MKVLIGTSSFGHSSDKALKMLKDEGYEVVINPYKRKMTEEEIIQQLEGVDGLLAGLEPLNKKVLNSVVNLKVIARVGIGMSNLDIETAKSLGIKVSNTPEGPTEAVAEATLAAMLNLTRDYLIYNEEMHLNQWSKKVSLGLKGTNVLIIGYGRIGKKVHELLNVFGANVKIYDPFVETDFSVSLEEGLTHAQVITIHASGEQPILIDEHFALMKNGVYILNPARGSIIEESSLIRALEDGKVSGVWLDTFWEEPYHGKLIEYKQALLTPHICTYTSSCRSSMELAAVQNLIRDLKGL